MKIVGWIGEPLSAVNGHAVIMVEPNEIADVEHMLKLIDGDSVGHFGVQAQVIGTANFNVEQYLLLKNQQYRGKKVYASTQFGYINASEMRKQMRYYDVFVHRD